MHRQLSKTSLVGTTLLGRWGGLTVLCSVLPITACGGEDQTDVEQSTNVVAPGAGSSGAATPAPGAIMPATGATSALPTQAPSDVMQTPMDPTPPTPEPVTPASTEAPAEPEAGGALQPPVAAPAPEGDALDPGSMAESPMAEPEDPTDAMGPDDATPAEDVPAADESSETPAAASSGPSSGCGTQTSLTSGNATIDVDGMSREYILKIPDGYDPSQPYKLIFGLHWRGGQASDVAQGTIGLGDYYGLDSKAQGSAIFVSPNGIDNGWANSGGRDIAFMRALVDLFEGELCIDMDRIFSVGFSFGGMMSFAIACEMGDVFRAVAPLSGALYSGCGNGTEPVAMWGAHGLSDDVVPIDDGRGGLAAVLERNHCGEQTMPVDPSPCVAYQGCDEGYPVTWCEFDGGHGPQGWQSQPIWDFFSQF